MKLFLQSLMVFFGTLLAAGVVALGEPGRDGLGPAKVRTSSVPVALNQGH